MPMTPPGLDALMDGVEAEISACVVQNKPSEAVMKLLLSWRAISAPPERDAFVAVLATYAVLAKVGGRSREPSR